MDIFSQRFANLKSAQKRSKGVPIYTLYFNRPVGRVIAAASPRQVTPNMLTAAGGVLTYLAIFLLMFFAGGTGGWMVVGVLLIIGFFFDSADGQLARLRKSSSLSGEWLDHVLDSGRIAFIHMATFWFLIRNDVASPTIVAAVCAVFGVAAVAVFYGGTLYEKLLPPTTKHQENLVVDARGKRRMVLRSALMVPVDYGTLCWIFILLPWPRLFFTLYVLLGLVKVATTVMLLAKWYGALRREDVALARPDATDVK